MPCIHFCHYVIYCSIVKTTKKSNFAVDNIRNNINNDFKYLSYPPPHPPERIRISATADFLFAGRIEKKQAPIRKIADLYIKRMNGIWKHVTNEPLIMKNTRNVAIFHFVFASNNSAGYKIAKDIIGRV